MCLCVGVGVCFWYCLCHSYHSCSWPSLFLAVCTKRTALLMPRTCSTVISTTLEDTLRTHTHYSEVTRLVSSWVCNSNELFVRSWICQCQTDLTISVIMCLMLSCVWNHVISIHRSFRNQVMTLNSSWQTTPNVWPVQWRSSYRLRRPWKVLHRPVCHVSQYTLPAPSV